MRLTYTVDLLGNAVEVWGPEQKDDYAAYISSAKWKIKARAALDRAGHKCQRCGRTKWSARLEVHHKTYERFKNERPEDLEVVCVACHAKADEERRTAVRRKNQRALHDARLDGWASKVYGDDWGEMDSEYIADKFEDWLDRKGYD